MTPEEAKNYRFDPFDITKVWPHTDYPLQPIGRMVLNRNPENFFAEVEQVAFSPGNFVPGIGPSPDRLLQGRLFSYHDTQRHRLGPNFHMLPVNAPKAALESSYQRDGSMRFDKNGGESPNYWPNSFGGPAPDPSYTVPPIDVAGMAARHVYEVGDVDFVQADALYSKAMSDMDRDHLVGNIVAHLNAAQKRIQLRQTALFYKVNAEYGERVAVGLGLNLADVKRLAAMSQEERVKAT
jgi:catalase